MSADNLLEAQANRQLTKEEFVAASGTAGCWQATSSVKPTKDQCARVITPYISDLALIVGLLPDGAPGSIAEQACLDRRTSALSLLTRECDSLGVTRKVQDSLIAVVKLGDKLEERDGSIYLLKELVDNKRALLELVGKEIVTGGVTTNTQGVIT